MRRPWLAILAVMALAACGAPPATTSSTAPSADSKPGASASGSQATPTTTFERPAPIGEEPDYPDLPAPSLTDGRAIGAALRDPDQVDDALSSFLAIAGIGIYRTDDTAVRVGNERGPKDLTLSEGAVHGLIAMGRADATDLAAGRTPATLADLPTGLAPLIGRPEADALLARFAATYKNAPDALMPGLTAGLDLTNPATPVNRVVLWAMLLDGFIPPSADTPKATTPFADIAAGPSALPTPGMQVTFIPSPSPGVDMRDFATLLAQLPGLAYAIPFDVATTASAVHEGHGGQGPSLEIKARHLPFYAPLPAPFSYIPSLLPSGRNPSGLPITFEASPADVLSKHGTLNGTLSAPTSTDATGTARLGYQVKKEAADGQGEQDTDVATITARVRLADLLDWHYILPPGAVGVVSGERVDVTTLQIDWHKLGQWLIDEPSGGGRITGLKCDGPGGDWKVDGTYKMPVGGVTANGTQKWVITIDKTTLKGPYRYHDDQVMKVGGVTVTTTADILGNATVSLDQTTGKATINLRETVHVITSKTSAGGTGSERNAPLQSSSMTWETTDACP